MNNFYFWLFGYLLFGLFSSSINWHKLHWGCQVWLYYAIVVFFSKLFAKIFTPLHFPLAAFVYITGFNTIRNVHLDDFSQESCKRTKMQRGKRTFEVNCFYERNHIFWIGLSFLLICLFSPFWLTNFICLCKMIGGLICQIGMVSSFKITPTHTQECDRRYKITTHLSSKYGRPLCWNARGENCCAFPHSTYVSPVISY